MNFQIELNNFNNLILEIYKSENLKCLRGEFDDDYILFDKNVNIWHCEACKTILNVEFNQFEKYIFIISENTQFSCIISNNRYFHSKITSSQIIDVNKLENLIVEIFHTYSYAISIKSINL